MRKSICCAIGLLLAATGCNPSIAKPNWLHPGSLRYQQWRAEIFDPYPQPDIGPPVVGSRPPQFATPAPEPQRNGPSLLQRFGPQPPKYTTATPWSPGGAEIP
jgi:hypothetical protein